MSESSSTPNNNQVPFTPSEAKAIADAYEKNCADARNRQVTQRASELLVAMKKACTENPHWRSFSISEFCKNESPLFVDLMVQELRRLGWNVSSYRWTGPKCDCTMMYGCTHPDVEQSSWRITW
jgi:hypothetical protein